MEVHSKCPNNFQFTIIENPFINLMVQSVDTTSVNILLEYNMIGHFNIYCTTVKQQQHQQGSYCYSKTVLYNGDSTVNISITGLLPNTTYTCCVLAVTSYRDSGPVCQNVTTAIDIVTSEYTNFYVLSLSLKVMIIFYTDMTCSHITDIVVSTVLVKTVTPVIISQCCTLNSTCIQTPIMSSDMFLRGGPWAAGGIMVGVVSGAFIMVMIWGLVTVIKKKRRNTYTKRHDER